MKHIRILSLSLALVMLLAACGKNNSDNQSSSASQPDVSVSMPEADVSAPDISTPDISTPDASQPEDETPAPEVKPEEKPEVKPEEKPMAPAVKPEAPAPVPGNDETIPLPPPEEKPEEKPEQAPVAPEQKPSGVDLDAFYQTIFTDPENSPALLPMDKGTLDAFYPGLTALSLNQTVAYMPMMTAVPCEIVMVECANSSDVDAVKALFQARIDAQVSDHFNYPMVIAAWETEAKVVSNGNFVALFVVSGMTDQVVANFNALF